MSFEYLLPLFLTRLIVRLYNFILNNVCVSQLAHNISVTLTVRSHGDSACCISFDSCEKMFRMGSPGLVAWWSHQGPSAVLSKGPSLSQTLPHDHKEAAVPPNASSTSPAARREGEKG